MDLHNGLDIEVYDLRPTDLHYCCCCCCCYYYYYYYYFITPLDVQMSH